MYKAEFLTVKEQQLWLSPERCIFWENAKALILSDLHFGKTGHFRKSGIAVPQNVFKEDLHRLVQQVQFFKAKRLIIAGDFTHSENNNELNLFKKWRKDLSDVSITLIKGNHDILDEAWYAASDISIMDKEMTEPPFRFLHDNEADSFLEDSIFTFSGHVHPGVMLSGLGKQSLRFPCFYFSTSFALLPAFSRFTGYSSVQKEQGSKVFAIVEKSIVEIK